MTWLAHAGRPLGRRGRGRGSGVVLAGPGAAPARSPSRINGVLTAVRGMVVHAVAAGQAPAGLVALLYEVADDRDLPDAARGEEPDGVADAGPASAARAGDGRWTGPVTARSSRCCGRVARRGTG